MTRRGSRRAALVLPIVAALVAAAALALLSVRVSGGYTVHFDDRARVWFWPSGEWGIPQRTCDIVVEGLQPRVTVSLLAVGALLAARRDRSARLVVPGAVAGVLLTVGLVLLRRSVTRLDLHGVDGSFPSGHEASIVVAAGTVALLVRWHRPVARAAAWLAVGLLAVLMAVALLVTGTHWCTDVLGGALLGGTVLGLTAPLVALLVRRPPPQPTASARSSWSATSVR